METVRKKVILAALEAEIEKAKVLAEQRRETAKHFRGASRSQQGDRRYFENAADLAESALSELLTLKEEIRLAPEATCLTAQPVAFISLKYQDGQTQNFYFVSRSVRLPNLPILTPQSPLGQAILGKKTGDSFFYQIERDGQIINYSGQIIKVE